MHKGRIEAFSDGVIAILITIMVLELKVPHGTELSSLLPLMPVFLSYVLSFIYLGIYWNNHHHMFQVVHKISGASLWANLHLLFWLSLVPFSSGWIAHDNFQATPVSVYGFNLLMCGVAYYILQQVLIRDHGLDSDLAIAIGRDGKGKFSLGTYALSMGVAFWQPWIALAMYLVVAIIWLVPDRRIERTVGKGSPTN